MTAVITPSAARTPENPGPRWLFESVTAVPALPLQPVTNIGADGERKPATLT
jgi:hypothetical protein